MKNEMHGIYGIQTNKEPFKGKTSTEIAELLKSWGVNAVWGVGNDKELIKTLQSREIKVFASVGAFVWRENKSAEDERVITLDGTPLKRYPKGHPGDWYMGNCPNGPEALKRLYSRVEEQMQYGINGVWLDAIRFANYWEWAHPEPVQNCFCPRCLERFRKDTGIDLPTERSTKEIACWILEKHEKEWGKWKGNVILQICRKCREIVRKYRPDGILGIYCVPWRETDFNDAITKIIAQDYGILGPGVDVFSPMVYHRMCNRPVTWITDITDYIADKTRKPVWPIVQSVNGPEGTMSNEEFAKALRAGLAGKSSGVSIFHFGGVMENNRLDVMAEIFTKRDAGK